jgi:hypothetical protein
MFRFLFMPSVNQEPGMIEMEETIERYYPDDGGDEW